jgi:hypothetical protein
MAALSPWMLGSVGNLSVIMAMHLHVSQPAASSGNRAVRVDAAPSLPPHLAFHLAGYAWHAMFPLIGVTSMTCRLELTMLVLLLGWCFPPLARAQWLYSTVACWQPVDATDLALSQWQLLDRCLGLLAVGLMACVARLLVGNFLGYHPLAETVDKVPEGGHNVIIWSETCVYV